MIGQTILVNSIVLWAQAAPASTDGAPLSQRQLDQQIALEAIRTHPGRGADILIPLAFFAFVALLVWMGTRRKRAQIEAQAEIQKQLLAKFTTGQELASFLETPGGQKFLDQLSAAGQGAKGRLLSGLRTGIVLTVLGVAMLLLSAVRQQQQHGMLTPAVLLLAIGIGFLISAAVSYRLTRSDREHATRGPENPLG